MQKQQKALLTSKTKFSNNCWLDFLHQGLNQQLLHLWETKTKMSPFGTVGILILGKYQEVLIILVCLEYYCLTCLTLLASLSCKKSVNKFLMEDNFTKLLTFRRPLLTQSDASSDNHTLKFNGIFLSFPL